MHLYSKLEQIIQTLTLGLCLRHIVTPYVAISTLAYLTQMWFGRNSHSMSPHEHSIGIWVGIHGLLQASRKVLLKSSVVNDRNPKSIKVP